MGILCPLKEEIDLMSMKAALQAEVLKLIETAKISVD